MVSKNFDHKISLLNFFTMKIFFKIFLRGLEKHAPHVLVEPVSGLVAPVRDGLKIFELPERQHAGHPDTIPASCGLSMPAGFAPYSVLIIFLDKRTRIVKMDTTATHTNREEWV